MVQMIFAALMGLSLYLPLMTGQLSLASAGFYALGGYVAAVMSTSVFPDVEGLFPLPWLLAEMGIAGVLCGVLALIVGIPALRLRGIYLALATIAFVEIVRVLSLNLPITGGAVGIFGIPQPFATKFEFMWVALPMLLLAIAFFYRLERTRLGRAFAAIREDELAAAAMGINTTYHKVLAFTLGAILAGVVGAVSAHFLNTWNARQGTFDASILYLAFVIIGGSRSFVGPVMGGLLLTALPEALRAAADLDGLPTWLAQFLRDGRLIIYGVLIAVGSIFFPQGLITPHLGRRFRRRPQPEQQPVAVGD
ncbi:MAG: branched-chain amino acid ABC transporter permease [Blastochloris sp.]|nr:branched-chain amino acid ABC transporter permease [Blastochloris sp.]